MFDKDKDKDKAKADEKADEADKAVATNAATSASGAWGSHNIVINTAEDGIQTVDVDFANGHHVHATSDDGGQAWSYEGRSGLGVDQMAAILDEEEASTEEAKPYKAPEPAKATSAKPASKDDKKK